MAGHLDSLCTYLDGVEKERVTQRGIMGWLFSHQNFKSTYREFYIPKADLSQQMDYVVDIVVMLSRQQRQVGHPRECRIRSRGEGKRMKCRRWSGHGHKRRMCKEPTNYLKLIKLHSLMPSLWYCLKFVRLPSIEMESAKDNSIKDYIGHSHFLLYRYM